LVSGRVQGVGFRAWVQDRALGFGLSGWVRNRRDGCVEAVFHGPPDIVAQMVEACRQGPRFADVTHADIREANDEEIALVRPGERFSILRTG
jgi:acylphosphatase